MTKKSLITKKRLQQLYTSSIELENQIERATRARNLIETAAAFPIIQEIRSNAGPEPIPAHLARIHEYETLVSISIEELYREKAEIEKAIQRLSDPRYREIIRLRYFDGAEWYEISAILKLSHRRTYQLHENALSAFGGDGSISRPGASKATIVGLSNRS